MNLIIKTLLRHRSSEQGFIIPTVISLGLIMLLIGTINIFKSNDEHITAIVQRDTREALTAAEAGIAFYQDLIDKNKVTATYPACENGLVWDDGGTADDTSDDVWTCSDTTESSWSRAATADVIPGIDSSCDFDGGNTNGQDVQNATLTGWQNINGSDGQYRLFDYTYDDSDPNNPVGTLIVEGRDDNTDDSAITRLQVQFPIQPGLNVGGTGTQITDDLNNLDPALWIGGGLITSIVHNSTTDTADDNLNVTGNILVYEDNCQLENTTLTTANNLRNITAVGVSIPNVPIQPTSILLANTTDIKDATDIKSIEVTQDEIKNRTLPLDGNYHSSYHDADGKNVYHYYVNGSLSFADGDSLFVQKGTEIILYVNGDISFDGDVNLNQNESSNTSKHLQIYSNSATNITFGGGNDKTINIKAFIHTPNATVTATSGNPTVNIDGAMWVADWNDTTSATNKVMITPDGRYIDYAGVRSLNGQSTLLIKPIIYPPTNWTTQNVN